MWTKAFEKKPADWDEDYASQKTLGWFALH
jgi:hypothetical protein